MSVSFLKPVQVRKTLDATMQTLQDMLTVEDFDVSDAFQHSRSTESIKSVASESYMSKLNIAKRRANQQETEMFYFSVSLSLLAWMPLDFMPLEIFWIQKTKWHKKSDCLVGWSPAFIPALI